MERTSELSNEALEQEIQRSGSSCCQKALAWSKNVTQKSSALADEAPKARCIHEFQGKGYLADYMLMVGAAPGNQAAAQENGVFYDPILLRREAQSWKKLRETGLTRLKEGNCAEYGMEKLQEFWKNLGV